MIEAVGTSRKLAAEFLGTGLLVMAVVGSGIMAEQLSAGNIGVALLANAIATGCALYCLIMIFAPISGAQFNPTVSVWLSLLRKQAWSLTALLIFAQLAGGVLGSLIANAMFDLDVFQVSSKLRGGTGQWLGEVVANFGLILVIAGVGRTSAAAVPAGVALYITSAYWFTSSTSFANPAVSFARMFSDTFAGIAPHSLLPFVVAQMIGMLLAWRVCRWLFEPST